MKDNITFSKAVLMPGNLRVCLYCVGFVSFFFLCCSHSGEVVIFSRGRVFYPVVFCVLNLPIYLAVVG